MREHPGIVASKAERQGTDDGHDHHPMHLLVLPRHRREVPNSALQACHDDLEVQEPAVGSRGDKLENLGGGQDPIWEMRCTSTVRAGVIVNSS